MTRTIRHSVMTAAAIMLLGTASEGAIAQTKCTSTSCGVVDRVDLVEKKGQGSGLGMIAGGVVGGVLGHQIGSGRGNTAATILGAGAGAYAGNEIEKNRASGQAYRVEVRMDNGDLRMFDYWDLNGLRVGDRVRVVNGQLERY